MEMKRLFFDQFFVACLLMIPICLLEAAMFLWGMIGALSSLPVSIFWAVTYLLLVMFCVGGVFAFYSLFFRCAAVGRESVVYLTPFRALRTDIRDLRFAYACSGGNFIDGYTENFLPAKRVAIDGYFFLSFAEGRLDGYGYQGRSSLEKAYGREIRLTVGPASGAASLLLAEFRGTIVVPSGVYRDNRGFFDSACKDHRITLEIVH
jgi:hypothetical protein